MRSLTPDPRGDEADLVSGLEYSSSHSPGTVEGSPWLSLSKDAQYEDQILLSMTGESFKDHRGYCQCIKLVSQELLRVDLDVVDDSRVCCQTVTDQTLSDFYMG